MEAMQKYRTARGDRRGVAMVLVSFVVMGVAVICLALSATVNSTGKQQRGSRNQVNAMFVAEAGLGDAMMRLKADEDANLGSQNDPVAYGSANYWVTDTDLGGGTHSLVAFGVENGFGSRLELIVREVPQTVFRWAAFGDEQMTMDSNAFVDSYDSGIGSYRSQEVNGSGGDTYANDGGNIGSNDNIALSQNATVYGDAVPGPGMTVTALGNSIISGATVPNPVSIDMPPVDMPPIASTGPYTLNGSASLGAGDHGYDAFLLETGAQLMITGPATFVLQSFEMASNAEIHIDATGGPVSFFVVDDFVMNSNTLIHSNTDTPADVRINLLSDNIIDPELEVDLDHVDFESNAQLLGTIYAPNAAIEINSNFELFGSIVARRVHLDSNARIHFDEALLQVADNTEMVFETVCWRQVPFRP